MMRIYKEFTFEAAHFLPSAPGGDPNSRLHGHSFLVRVSVDGEADPETGLLLHLEDFAEKLSALKDKLDHRLLNEIEGLGTPALERIAVWVWRQLEPDLRGLAEVRVSRPTCREGCIYTGPESR
jgi:6-pyruvoyltetrahydropterin/6-carboxytetrahydropterin synthase